MKNEFFSRAVHWLARELNAIPDLAHDFTWTRSLLRTQVLDAFHSVFDNFFNFWFLWKEK